MAAEPASKKQKTDTEYTLLYHGGDIPGRGEFIRFAFEVANVPFLDAANASKAGSKEVYSLLGQDVTSVAGNPPAFAPPMLRASGAGRNGGDLVLYQTPNILLYLGPKLGLAGDDEIDALYVNEIALTALDLTNEAHDSHHPIANAKYYEEQKEEALRRSVDFRETRIPKFMSYLERTLKGNKAGQGKYFVGGKLTYADTTVWHVLDGLYFGFPNEMAARKEEFPGVLKTFYEAFKEEESVKAYLDSGRKMKFSNCMFRHYPELDRP